MMDMGLLSGWHWLLVLIVAVLVIVPFWRILPRAGIPAWFSVLAIVPGIALLFLWIIAFKRWPNDP